MAILHNTAPSVQPLGHHIPAVSCDVLVIGAGAAGLIAAMRAVQAGADVIVLERDALARGSTSLSAGLVPAAETRFQKEAQISDTKAIFEQDILVKSHGEADRNAVSAVVDAVGPAIEWLSDRHGLPFSVIENFSYPGHSARRMHGLPSRSGVEMMDRLRQAADATGVTIIENAVATTLLTDGDNRIAAVVCKRPDGQHETVGCNALILACNGYGGAKDLVRQHIPELSDALYFGHPGNQGDAILWGEQLGAATRHLSGHQGHGSVAHPQGILITWATMTEGGFQVNQNGERFSDESRGYSEQAEAVLKQPGNVVWSIFDERIAAIARQFEDFRNAEAMGAIISASTVAELAAKLGLPADALAATYGFVATHKCNGTKDSFGRNWKDVFPLQAPFCAVKVTGALFHTQGGLVVDHEGRVLRPDGKALPNLFAAGGAACGVSGAQASGYLSGNGLLTAFAYGYLAGKAAADLR